ncbi:hypothetical protein RJ44_14995 [Alteromonas macleodii]|uniref:Sua5/YciO/YrdC/YwlC family protein n=1 Tax=Alteromonas macleodii TaxID=28108 RepID=UPI00057D81C3|nr:Sua5/YciO/YrdC/YwlC family protein [Alteromonas macleodii]KHT57730.1 hypothetical protein RJ44_14995 [Alteromonas macleodii]
MKDLDYKEIAAQAFNTIRAGGLALTPADIGYGLLGNTEASINKMYALKGRAFTNPCIIAGNADVLSDVADLPDDGTLEWLTKITKEYTLAAVFPIRVSSKLIAQLPDWVREHSTENNTIAVFLNCGPVVEEMVRLAFNAGMLLVGSSGNFSKTGNNFRLNDVPEAIREGVDFFADYGTSKYENPSRMATTILNFSNHTIRRRGVNSTDILASYEQFAKEKGLPKFVDQDSFLPIELKD